MARDRPNGLTLVQRSSAALARGPCVGGFGESRARPPPVRTYNLLQGGESMRG